MYHFTRDNLASRPQSGWWCQNTCPKKCVHLGQIYIPECKLCCNNIVFVFWWAWPSGLMLMTVTSPDKASWPAKRPWTLWFRWYMYPLQSHPPFKLNTFKHYLNTPILWSQICVNPLLVLSAGCWLWGVGASRHGWHCTACFQYHGRRLFLCWSVSSQQIRGKKKQGQKKIKKHERFRGFAFALLGTVRPLLEVSCQCACGRPAEDSVNRVSTDRCRELLSICRPQQIWSEASFFWRRLQ